MSPKGYLSMVLHAHLPYVRHPEHSYHLEENWLYEAITETYLPLLWVFENLAKDNVKARFTVSLSPPLISMWDDHLLRERYLGYLDRTINLAHKEVERTKGESAQFHQLACMYKDRLEALKSTYMKAGKDLVGAYSALQRAGVVELITAAGTHGFLPLMVNRNAQYAQVKSAVDLYRKRFGADPRGMWLPECGYVHGVEEILAECGVEYFFVDTHSVLDASPPPVYGPYSPVWTQSGVAAFCRDPESTVQVWSAEQGYPGDPWYREYYRDVGWDREFEYIRPYIHPDGIRLNTGLKYFRITGRSTDHKEPYNPDVARERAASHAGNFMFNRQKQIEHLAGNMDRAPMVVCPYDAELYGHWWYEGPMFLDFLARKIFYDQQDIAMASPGDYLDAYPFNQVCSLAASSWGDGGYAGHWLNGANDWLYRHLHQIADMMETLARNNPGAEGLRKRALTQAAREVLLAQASDWAFILKTGTQVGYAIKRSEDHIRRFLILHDMVAENRIDEGFLADVEYKDNLFPDLNYTLFAGYQR